MFCILSGNASFLENSGQFYQRVAQILDLFVFLQFDSVKHFLQNHLISNVTFFLLHHIRRHISSTPISEAKFDYWVKMVITKHL